MTPSQQEVMKCVIECAKKAKTEYFIPEYGGIQMINPNLFIQELEKTLEV